MGSLRGVDPEIGQSGYTSLLEKAASSPRAQLVFVHCTETCVGALVKNVNGAGLQIWGWGSGSLNLCDGRTL